MKIILHYLFFQLKLSENLYIYIYSKAQSSCQRTYNTYIIRRKMPYTLKINIKIFGGTDTTPGSRVYLGINKTTLKCYDYTIPPLQPINELIR
jgi:hypothetical protein